MTVRIGTLAALIIGVFPFSALAAEHPGLPAQQIRSCAQSCPRDTARPWPTETEKLNTESLIHARQHAAAPPPVRQPDSNEPTIAAGTGVLAPDAATVPSTER